MCLHVLLVFVVWARIVGNSDEDRPENERGGECRPALLSKDMQKRRCRAYCRIYIEGSDKPFLVDAPYALAIKQVRWKYDPKKRRARGWLANTKTRQFLHRYVLTLARRRYAEATFANDDPRDCRLVNIRPYSRTDDGAGRRLFKNSTTGRKGVSFHKGRKKWIAAIRVRGKLKHLGYFSDPEMAAAAYYKAWRQAYPNKKEP